MRVLVLALAILLLPLRGWLGDAMAIGTAQPAAVAQAMHATHATHAMAADDHGTHDLAGTSHEGHDMQEASHHAPASPDCQSTCNDCQLCHSVAMTLWPEAAAPIEAPRAAPAFQPAAFASTEPAPGLKPPIS
ncbi:MAG: hypothetical protein EOP81_07505 [Variovorax sp.]|nr:MAG: hypothetical protein EOP81_07505 [Variovorax sp.]